MRLRPVSRADLDRVRQLRNANREWFFNSREISAAEQSAWFEALATRPVQFFVIEDEDRIVGTISLTVRGDQIEVGNLTLDAAARGRGMMRQAVAAVTARPGRYFAEVKSDNERSLRVFRAAGFAEAAAGGVIRFSRSVGD